MSLVLEKYILMYDNDRCKEMIICHMVFGPAELNKKSFKHFKAGFFSSSLELAREIILKSLEISLAVKSQKIQQT